MIEIAQHEAHRPPAFGGGDLRLQHRVEPPAIRHPRQVVEERAFAHLLQFARQFLHLAVGGLQVRGESGDAGLVAFGILDKIAQRLLDGGRARQHRDPVARARQLPDELAVGFHPLGDQFGDVLQFAVQPLSDPQHADGLAAERHVFFVDAFDGGEGGLFTIGEDDLDHLADRVFRLAHIAVKHFERPGFRRNTTTHRFFDGREGRAMGRVESDLRLVDLARFLRCVHQPLSS